MSVQARPDNKKTLKTFNSSRFKTFLLPIEF